MTRYRSLEGYWTSTLHNMTRFSVNTVTCLLCQCYTTVVCPINLILECQIAMGTYRTSRSDDMSEIINGFRHNSKLFWSQAVIEVPSNNYRSPHTALNDQFHSHEYLTFRNCEVERLVRGEINNRGSLEENDAPIDQANGMNCRRQYDPPVCLP